MRILCSPQFFFELSNLLNGNMEYIQKKIYVLAAQIQILLIRQKIVTYFWILVAGSSKLVK